jgi:hypothetical protein
MGPAEIEFMGRAATCWWQEYITNKDNFFLHMALQPNAGYGLLIHEVFEITHTTRHSR